MPVIVAALFCRIEPAEAGLLPLEWHWFEGASDSYRTIPNGFFGSDVIGNYHTAYGIWHGFLCPSWSGWGMTVEPPGAVPDESGVASEVSFADSKYVYGTYFDGTQWRGFTYDGKAYRTGGLEWQPIAPAADLIPPVPIPPYDTEISAYSEGSAAGFYFDPRARERGYSGYVPFVFDGHSYFTADPYYNYQEFGITVVSGDMAAGYDFDRGVVFIGQTPEPGSLLLLSLGGAALVGARRFRRFLRPPEVGPTSFESGSAQ